MKFDIPPSNLECLMMNISLFILNNGQALLNIPVNNIKHNINLNILHLTIASQYRYYFNSNANYNKNEQIWSTD